MTYLCQLEQGLNSYIVQTDDKKIREKLMRRKGFTPAGTQVLNRDIWIFDCEFSRPDIAKDVLKSVTGAKPQFGSDGVIFYDPSYSAIYKKTKAPKGKNGSESKLMVA
jgi:hypothetical protein